MIDEVGMKAIGDIRVSTENQTTEGVSLVVIDKTSFYTGERRQGLIRLLSAALGEHYKMVGELREFLANMASIVIT